MEQRLTRCCCVFSLLGIFSGFANFSFFFLGERWGGISKLTKLVINNNKIKVERKITEGFFYRKFQEFYFINLLLFSLDSPRDNKLRIRDRFP